MTPSDIALAHRLADAAGAAIRPHLRSGIGHRGQGRCLARHARRPRRRRGDAPHPEGRGAARRDRSARNSASSARARAGSWVLDPIDGTTSFARRAADLRHADRAAGRWLSGAGRDRPADPAANAGSARRAARRRSTAREVAHAAPAASCRDATARHHRAQHYSTITTASTSWRWRAKTAHRRMIWGGDCYNYGLLASGQIDLVCEAGLKLHDFAALVPVVEGAGGHDGATGTAIRCTPAATATSSRWAIRRGWRTWSRRSPAGTEALG